MINSPTFVRRCVSAYSRNFRGSYKRTQLFIFYLKTLDFQRDKKCVDGTPVNIT